MEKLGKKLSEEKEAKKKLNEELELTRERFRRRLSVDRGQKQFSCFQPFALNQAEEEEKEMQFDTNQVHIDKSS